MPEKKLEKQWYHDHNWDETPQEKWDRIGGGPYDDPKTPSVTYSYSSSKPPSKFWGIVGKILQVVIITILSIILLWALFNLIIAF